MEMVRAFLALDLPDEVKERIMKVEEDVLKSGADVKLVDYENLHVTLKFLGDVDSAKMEEVNKVMDGIKEKRFQLEAKGTGVFPNSRSVRVLWVGVGKGGENVRAIYEKLDEGLANIGFKRELEFTPHITIGRVRSGRNKQLLLEAMERNASKSFGIAKIEKVVLKKSVLMTTGPLYSNLREIDLE